RLVVHVPSPRGRRTRSIIHARATPAGCWCRRAPAPAPPTATPRCERSSLLGRHIRAKPGLAVVVVVVPPLVRRRLGVALRRVLPLLLASERGDVEVGPGGAHRLVATAIDEVGAIDAVVVVAVEDVVAMPLV